MDSPAGDIKHSLRQPQPTTLKFNLFLTLVGSSAGNDELHAILGRQIQLWVFVPGIRMRHHDGIGFVCRRNVTGETDEVLELWGFVLFPARLLCLLS